MPSNVIIVPVTQTVYPVGGTKTFGQMKLDIAAHVGMDQDPAKVALAGRHVLGTIDDLNRKQVYVFNIVESSPIVTVAGQSTYSIPADFWKTYNARKTSDIDYAITTVRQWEFDDLFVSQANISGFPYVMVIRNTFRDGTVTLFPTPDSGYTFKIRYFKLIAKPASDDGYLDLPEPYQNVPEYGALSKMSALAHQMDLAKFWIDMFREGYRDMSRSDEDQGEEQLRFINIEELLARSTSFINPAARPRAYDLY